MIQEILSTKAALSYLGVTRNTLKAWAKKGILQPCKTDDNGTMFWARSDLDRAQKGRNKDKQRAGLKGATVKQSTRKALEKDKVAKFEERMEAAKAEVNLDMTELFGEDGTEIPKAAQIQKYIYKELARQALNAGLLETIVAGLKSDDYKERHAFTETVMRRITPSMKSVNHTHGLSDDAQRSADRAIALIEARWGAEPRPELEGPQEALDAEFRVIEE